MTRAYVLMTVEIGRAGDVYEALSHFEGVSEVSVVAGTYDLVAVITAENARAIGALVMDRIQRVDGVMGTVTLIAIG
ncbi:MAG TPA: Lrp/AsnC ligand binding domain-containing protein [Thermomicrobiaceae bacterium]|nr:Lrp/AsnC ligand binding domain-containing protein [Thermomicrobiaceae bacterium]